MKTDYKKFKEASKRVAEVEAEAERRKRPSVIIRKMATDCVDSDTARRSLRELEGVGIADMVVTALILIDSILDYLDEQYEKENHE